jgi:hypothetical protein
MTLTKTLTLASLAAAAAIFPVSATPGTTAEIAHGKLFKIQVTCAAAQEAALQDEFSDSNSGCQPAAAYVCTTPRADYLDKRPI